MKRRGVGLGVTLVIVALLAVVGFTLAALTVGRIQILSRLEGQRRAHELALSAVHTTLGQLRSQPNYGLYGTDPLISIDNHDGNSARLAFGADLAGSSGIPPSFNNLGGLTPLSSPQNVPASSARLVAEGRYAGNVERLEVLLTQPVFPFALASTGPIHSSQGLIIASLDDESDAARQKLLSDPARYGRPANLLSNSSSADSVQILGPSTICGDLQSAGQVDLAGNPITILGELREHQDIAAIPDIPLSSLNLGSNPTILTGAPTSSPTLNGSLMCNGPFTCSGDLTLQGANLYVKGDLQVGGELRGNGTLVVEGSTNVHGTTDLTSQGRLALVSMGDITLSGSGPSSSYFKGIVYTKGRLTAHGLMVYGCLLGAPPGPSGPQLDLQDCVVVQDASPIPGNSSDPVQTRADIRRVEATSASSILTNLKVQVLSPGHLKVRFTDPLSSSLVTEQVVQINVASSRNVIRTALQAAHSGANTLSIGNPYDQGPGLTPVAGTLGFLKLPLDPAEDTQFEEGLKELQRRVLQVASQPLFDLNRFIQSKDRLRIASCRRI